MLSSRFGPIQYLQVFGFAVLCMLAAGPAMVAARAFHDLSANYQDGSETTCLAVGVLCSAVALIPFGIGVRALCRAAGIVKATAFGTAIFGVGLVVLIAG